MFLCAISLDAYDEIENLDLASNQRITNSIPISVRVLFYATAPISMKRQLKDDLDPNNTYAKYNENPMNTIEVIIWTRNSQGKHMGCLGYT